MTLTREPLPALTDERRAALEAFAEAGTQVATCLVVVDL